MKKTVLILTTILISFFSVQGQTWETIGSGVADFLLSNPKTADKMKPEHQVALGIIGNLLNTSGQRKHELNVAEAGRTQMNFNTNSGQQIQLVMDANGSVYALSNGIIYPISQNIVNEAKEYVLNQQDGYMDYVRKNNEPSNNQIMLPDYNISILKNTWDKPQSIGYIKLKCQNRKTLSEIKSTYNVEDDKIYILHNNKYKSLASMNGGAIALNRYQKGKFLLDCQNGYQTISAAGGQKDGWWKGYNYYLLIKGIVQQNRGSFCAKWLSDLNNNGVYEFQEFNDIRRNFYENENFVIATGLFYSEKYNAKLTILDQLTGKEKTSVIQENKGKYFDHCYFNIHSNILGPGIYVYNISFISTQSNEVIESISDKFQILSLEQPKNLNSNENKKNFEDSSKSSSKEDMINDLIQLLKDGKISEETFKASMKALEIK